MTSSITNTEELTNGFSDEAFLHQYFHHYLHHMYDNSIDNMLRDGFEASLDPDYLCEAIHQLARRLGYSLVDNMWHEEVSSELQSLTHPTKQTLEEDK